MKRIAGSRLFTGGTLVAVGAALAMGLSGRAQRTYVGFTVVPSGADQLLFRVLDSGDVEWTKTSFQKIQAAPNQVSTQLVAAGGWQPVIIGPPAP